jgi:RNA polymerase sigma-70 factor, ECF subfamily
MITSTGCTARHGACAGRARMPRTSSRETFVSQRRSAARRPQTAPLPDEADLLEDPRAVRAESRAESNELYALIAILPPHFRDVLIAVDLVGLSYREAAQSLRVREATITTRLHRARQRIAKSLAVHGGPG